MTTVAVAVCFCLQLAEWMAAGRLTPVLDRCYALAQVPEALTCLETAHARGKVVIVVESAPA